jgi:cytochrome c5
MRWLLSVSFVAAAAVAMAQTPGLPAGEGQAIVNGACTSCHGVDLITGKKATQQDWAGIVDRMRGYGVTLNDAQVKTLMDYLVKNFSPGAAAPAGDAPAGATADEEGKTLVAGLCSSCHGADLTTAKKADRTEWQGIVDRMKSYGATLDARQTTVLVDYLVKFYGPGGAPAATPVAAAAAAPAAGDGKRLLESFCGGCHDLDLVSGRKGTRSEWQEIVDRMNGRGAGVPEADIPTLVDFLTKTYAAN